MIITPSLGNRIGIAKGIGAQGALRFQPNGGAERLLYSGDVSVRRQVAS